MFWGRQMSNSQGDKQFQMHHCQDEHAIKCLALARDGRGDEHWQNWLVQLKFKLHHSSKANFLLYLPSGLLHVIFTLKQRLQSVHTERFEKPASFFSWSMKKLTGYSQKSLDCPLSKITANETAAQRRALARWQHYRAVCGQKKAWMFVR